MKMKRTLSIILGGALLVGSSSLIFANDAIKLTNQAQDQSVVSTDVTMETTETEIDEETKVESETPSVTIEVLDEIINNLDTNITIDTEDEDFKHELLRLLESILLQLEQVNTKIDEKATDDTEETNMVEEDEEIEIEIEIEDEDENDDENDGKDEKLVLENLYRKLLQYQLVYEKVPAQAKPAIEKNIKKVQLKIVDTMVKMNIDLNSLVSEINIEQVQNEIAGLKEKLESDGLTEEGRNELLNAIAKLEDSISNHNEISKLIVYVTENQNWQRDLKATIHEEFKAKKAQVKIENKLAKEEIKQAKKQLQAQIKANKESIKIKEKTVKVDKKAVEKAIKLEKKSKEEAFGAEKKISEESIKGNQKSNTAKSHPVKENHPGKGNGKNK